jgi:hypothetical protein
VRFRRNADVDLRELDRRAAASGHPHDVEAAVRARIHAGLVTAEWIVAAGPIVVKLLPTELVESLSKTLQASVVVRPAEVSASGHGNYGWFPNHRGWDVCPRGHEIGPEQPFTYTLAGEEVEEVSAYSAGARGLELHDDWETQGSGLGAYLITCTACIAVWPSSAGGLLT